MVQHAAPALAPLPLALVLHILSLLPVDCRLLCTAVCRSWRAALEERSLWIRLDLSASVVNPKREATDALLHAAAARARGQLLTLDLRGCESVTFDALLAVVTANGAALRELRTRRIINRYGQCQPLQTNPLEALLRAAPRVAVCEADLLCFELAIARRLLRNEPPYAPLHVRSFEFDGRVGELDEAAVLAVASDTASHAHLRRFELNFAGLHTAAALDAVVDAALTRRLTSLALRWCNLLPQSTPGLVRLIGGGALAELEIVGGNHVLLDVPAAHALGNALRTSGTLTAVTLSGVGMWGDLAAATALLGALTGHPSLSSLNISYNRVDPAGREEAGACIAALVAANAPALQELNVDGCRLGDAELRPLFDALPANTHLRKLNCIYNDLSDAFMRERLLPAVRANSSLRKLEMGEQTDAAREAQAIVQRRADAE
jgi:hypothetical protein